MVLIEYIAKYVLISLQFLSPGTELELRKCENIKVLKYVIRRGSK